MTELEQKKLETFEDMVDRYCESIGVRATIDMLMEDYDFTKEELLEMNFDEEDVDDYLENTEAEV